MIPDSAAVILAGGRSSRMGRPKAWLEFGGRPLLALLVEQLQPEFGELLVVGAPGQRLPETPARVLSDDVPGLGPLGGMAVGLREARPGHGFAFVVACDTPFVSLPLAEYLVNVCACYDAAVPCWDGRLQPLHAVYRTSIQPVVQELLDEGERRAHALLERVRTVTVGETEVRALAPEPPWLRNLNTPDEYEAARRAWEAGGRMSG